MTKTEKALIRKEIRAIKSALNRRQKLAARAVKNHRDFIRAREREIAAIEREIDSLTVATNDRLAILDGRLLSR